MALLLIIFASSLIAKVLSDLTTCDLCDCYNLQPAGLPITFNNEICYTYLIHAGSDEDYCDPISSLTIGTNDGCGMGPEYIDYILLDYAPKCYDIDTWNEWGIKLMHSSEISHQSEDYAAFSLCFRADKVAGFHTKGKIKYTTTTGVSFKCDSPYLPNFCRRDSCAMPTTALPTTTSPTTADPTARPTDQPTPRPTPQPSEEPTPFPTDVPSDTPTDSPTDEPTEEPTPAPTGGPSDTPTETPTDEPTEEPTPAPTGGPSDTPTQTPTHEPTDEPTYEPTDEPTPAPTGGPSNTPTETPTDKPTAEPTDEPTEEPTPSPTDGPTPNPTPRPTPEPTPSPTPKPTPTPTTSNPTTDNPTTAIPTQSPTFTVCNSTDPYNIAFLLDESGSISREEWDIIIDFVGRIVDFDVQDDSYVALYEFASLPGFQKYLNFTGPKSTEQDEMMDALETMRNRYTKAGQTETWDAVNRVLDDYYQVTTNPDHDSVGNILFVVTDGNPTDEAGDITQRTFVSLDYNTCPYIMNRLKTQFPDNYIDIVLIIIDPDGNVDTSKIECLDYFNNQADIIPIVSFDSTAFHQIEERIRDKICTDGATDGFQEGPGTLEWVYPDGNIGLGPVPIADNGGVTCSNDPGSANPCTTQIPDDDNELTSTTKMKPQ